MTHSTEQCLDCRPQALDCWLAELPRASVGKTAELIYKALQDIHSQQLKASERFQALEKLRESVNYVSLNMRKHFSGLTYPLPDKVMLISSACQSINEHMAKGYRKVFYELQKQSFLFVDKKMLVTTVHRSITYLHRCLLITYETYSAYHRDYWEQLHELYQYSEIHKIKNQSVTDAYLKTTRKSTIESEYMRACLLLLAEPYHLRTGEIETINRYLESWYELAEVEVISKEKLLDAGIFVIELDKDQPPHVTGKIPVTSQPDYIRCINLDKLLIRLKQDLDKQVAYQNNKHGLDKQSDLSISLLQRLIDIWSHSKNRRFPRQQVFKKVNVTVGLHNTHRQLMYELFMSDTEKLKEASSGFNKPKYDSIEIKGVGTEQFDIWSTVYNWANENKSKNPEVKNSISGDEIFDNRVKQDNWTLLNESANGFALMTVEKEGHKLQVGEIISIQRPGSANREIGVVRWLKGYSNTGVEIGCMLLAPSAKPIGLVTENIHEHGTDKIVNRGLLLPNLPIIHQTETILTFSRNYQNKDSILVNLPGGDDFNIELTGHVADNDSVSQYNFVRDEYKNQNSEKDLSDSNENENEDAMAFYDVWRNI